MARKINACDLHQGDVFELTQDEANGLEQDYRMAHPNNKTTMPGFHFAAAEPHKDRWDKLPAAS
ncbi:MAG: hypothetical protein ACLP4V_18670 [Methylocella sp.]